MNASRPLVPALALCAAALALPAGAVTTTFSNTAPITIVDAAAANPYPSLISVSGLVGTIDNIQVLLNGFSHSFPDDTAAVVVAPSGTAVLLFSGAGLNVAATNLNFVFDDHAAATLPATGALASGTYKPGLNEYNDNFPAPGPGTSYGTSFAPWTTQNVNGGWRLFILDALTGDAGSVSGGWALSFDVTPVPEPGTVAMMLAGLAVVGGLRRKAR